MVASHTRSAWDRCSVVADPGLTAIGHHDGVSEDLTAEAGASGDEPEVVVTINGLNYAVAAATVTGAAIRRLTHPRVPPGDDVFLRDDNGNDRRVGDDDVITIDPGTTLYTVPRTILAGAPLSLRAPSQS